MEGIGANLGLGKWINAPQDGNKDVMGKLAHHMIKEQDADKSGDLTLDETKLDQKGFDNIDRNGDGVITREEIHEGLQEKKGDIVTILQQRSEELQTYGPPKGAPRSIAGQLMSTFDADGSQDLTQAETGLDDAAFAVKDIDGDGLLTSDELAIAVQDRLDEARTFLEEVTRPPQKKAEEVLADVTTGLMEELDADDNGEINLEESTLSDELFSRLDSNGDGVLSSEEIAKALANQPDLAREFLTAVYGEGKIPGLPENWIDRMAEGLTKAFDKDNSGDVSQKESGLEADAFASLDANGDGVLTDNEISDGIAGRSDATREMTDKYREDNPHKDPRIRRAMASYRGNMGELMTEVFKGDEGTQA